MAGAAARGPIASGRWDEHGGVCGVRCVWCQVCVVSGVCGDWCVRCQVCVVSGVARMGRPRPDETPRETPRETERMRGVCL
jgi:hypothetical protein